MNTTMISLVAVEAKSACEGLTTIEEMIPAAMKAAKNHFMCPSQDEAFKGACCALYELASEDDKERIKEEMESLKYLSALMSGVSVNLDAMPKVEKPLGLMRAFHDAKEG